MKLFDKIKNMMKPKEVDSANKAPGLDEYDSVECSKTLTVDIFYGHEVMRINGVPFSFGAVEKLAEAFSNRDGGRLYIPLRQDTQGLVSVTPDASKVGDVEPEKKVLCCGCKKFVSAGNSYIIHGMIYCSTCYIKLMEKKGGSDESKS